MNRPYDVEAVALKPRCRHRFRRTPFEPAKLCAAGFDGSPFMPLLVLPFMPPLVRLLFDALRLVHCANIASRP